MLVVLAFTFYNFEWLCWWLPQGAASLIALACLTPLIFGLPAVFRKDLRTAVPASAMSAFGVLYIAVSTGLADPAAAPAQNEYLIVFHSLFRVGRRHCRLLHRQKFRHAQASAQCEPKQDLGGLRGLGPGQYCHRDIWCFTSVKASTTFFFSNRRSISRSRKPFSLAHVIALALITNVAAQFGDLFESAVEAWRGSKGFRHASSRPWRHAGPH